MLRWPAEAGERRRLHAAGVPRLLLVADGEDPPADLDELEDWLRGPFAPTDLSARTERLRRRAREAPVRPMLDHDGLLRHRGHWVAIPDSQLVVVQLLLDRLGSLVRTDELAAAYAAGGGNPNRRAVSMLVVRLRSRLAELGLQLHVVRRRGVVLEAA